MNSGFYYIPPCALCELEFNVYELKHVPVLCRDCNMTVCWNCSNNSSKCPLCPSINIPYVNKLLFDYIKQTKPLPRGQTYVDVIDPEQFDVLINALSNKKKCCIQ